jgi:thioredoxin reductase (NADPH)
MSQIKSSILRSRRNGGGKIRTTSSNGSSNDPTAIVLGALPLHYPALLSPSRATFSLFAQSQRRQRLLVTSGGILLLFGLAGVSVYRFHEDTISTTGGNNLESSILLGIDGPIHDIVIAGAGPGGLTAALFGARAGLDVFVLGSEMGLLSETRQLNNFPSYSQGNGPDWLKTTKRQALQFGATFATPGVLATELTRDQTSGLFTLTTTAPNRDEHSVHAWSVIVASGATLRRLGLPKEDLLWGRTMHNCAICDGHLYLDRTVLVVGGGDSATDASILLARYAKQVYLVHRRSQFSGKNQAAIEVAETTDNITILKPYEVTDWELDTDNQLTGARIRNTELDIDKVLSVDGVFVMIGAIPNTQWLSGAVDLDHGLVKLEGATQTSTTGLFAVGEVSDHVYKQAITASAEGAQAAIDAERWLRETRGVHKHINVSKSQPKVVVESEKRGELEEGDRGRGIQCDLMTEECIKEVVGQNAVVVFSKSWCPYCRTALEVLNIAGIAHPMIVDLTENENAKEIQAALESMTGRRTVPNIFVGGRSIGGGQETSALQAKGKLVPLLVEAGALQPLATNENDEHGASSCNLAERSCVEGVIRKYPVLMFTLSWCPECSRTLEFLSSVGAERPQLIDLEDYDKDVQVALRNNMMAISGRRSVPNLFVGGEFVGGYAQTLKMHEAGQLVAKLRAVGWHTMEHMSEGQP